MDSDIKKGDKILIELNNHEIFEGTIINKTDNFIQLTNIYSRLEGRRDKMQDFLKFFKREITSIRFIGPRKNESTSSGQDAGGNSGISHRRTGGKGILLDENEFYRLQDMTKNTIYIDSKDKNYYDAIDVLKNAESIGVVGVGSTFTRQSFSFLFLCNFNKIYIFDMMSEVINIRHLKEIFEADYITKVVHDVSPLYDCLFHRYKIKLTNIFDTQVADSRVHKEESGQDICRNLSQCLEHHFNFPPLLLDAAMYGLLDENWVQRPIIRSQMINGGQLVVYLLTLRDLLLRKMLKSFHDDIAVKCQIYEKLSDFEVLQQLKNLKL